MMLKHEGPATPEWVKRQQWFVRLILIGLMLGILAACARPAAPVRTVYQDVVIERPVPCMPAIGPVVPDWPSLTGQAQADAMLLAAHAERVRQMLALVLIEAAPCRAKKGGE